MRFINEEIDMKHDIEDQDSFYEAHDQQAS